MNASQPAPARSRQTDVSGFSLVETLVVLALLVALLAQAVPAVTSLRSRHELQAVAEDLWNSLMLARGQALERQQRVAVCPAESRQACDPQSRWGKGWLVFADITPDGVREPDEPVLQHREALQRGTLLSGNSTVSLGIGYAADGKSAGPSGAFQSGTLTLCRPGLKEGWKIVINSVGRPRLQRVDIQECA